MPAPRRPAVPPPTTATSHSPAACRVLDALGDVAQRSAENLRPVLAVAVLSARQRPFQADSVHVGGGEAGVVKRPADCLEGDAEVGPVRDGPGLARRVDARTRDLPLPQARSSFPLEICAPLLEEAVRLSTNIYLTLYKYY